MNSQLLRWFMGYILLRASKPGIEGSRFEVAVALHVSALADEGNDE
jgi:hypothetical protein